MADLHIFTSTSRTLLQNIRRNLGLNPNASPNKIIEAVQVLSQKALDDCNGADIVNTLKNMLKVENDEDVVPKVRDMCGNAEKINDGDEEDDEAE